MGLPPPSVALKGCATLYLATDFYWPFSSSLPLSSYIGLFRVAFVVLPCGDQSERPGCAGKVLPIGWVHGAVEGFLVEQRVAGRYPLECEPSLAVFCTEIRAQNLGRMVPRRLTN